MGKLTIPMVKSQQSKLLKKTKKKVGKVAKKVGKKKK